MNKKWNKYATLSFSRSNNSKNSSLSRNQNSQVQKP